MKEVREQQQQQGLYRSEFEHDNMEKLYKHKIVNVLGSENKLAQLD